MPYLDVTGAQIYYEDTGGDGQVVLLAHALLLDQDMLAPQVSALRDGYRVITWDARGHGATRYDEAAFDIWDLARDQVALLDHLGVEQAVLGGLSLGGEACLRAALLAPDRVRALVLCGTLAGASSPTVREGYERLAIAARDGGALPELADSLLELLVEDPSARAHWAAKPRVASAEAIFHSVACAFGRDDLTGRLAELTAPTLLLHGTADPLIALVRAEWLAQELPGGSGVIAIDGAGHLPSLTHPAAVEAELRKFLDGLPVTPAVDQAGDRGVASTT